MSPDEATAGIGSITDPITDPAVRRLAARLRA
jgi:hypothetical protein